MTIADRLTLALKDAPEAVRGDKKKFTAAMARTGVEGVSYPTVIGYFSDKVKPSPEWLSAAAELLGVRAEWLAFGTGGRDENEARSLAGLAAEAEDSRSAVPQGAATFRDAIRQEFPMYDDVSEAHAAIFSAFMQAAQAEWARPGRRWSQEAESEVARRVGRTLNAPFREFQLDADDLKHYPVSNYVFAACAALAALFADPYTSPPVGFFGAFGDVRTGPAATTEEED